jgi:hypothetical protein
MTPELSPEAKQLYENLFKALWSEENSDMLIAEMRQQVEAECSPEVVSELSRWLSETGRHKDK